MAKLFLVSTYIHHIDMDKSDENEYKVKSFNNLISAAKYYAERIDEICDKYELEDREEANRCKEMRYYEEYFPKHRVNVHCRLFTDF